MIFEALRPKPGTDQAPRKCLGFKQSCRGASAPMCLASLEPHFLAGSCSPLNFFRDLPDLPDSRRCGNGSFPYGLVWSRVLCYSVPEPSLPPLTELEGVKMAGSSWKDFRWRRDEAAQVFVTSEGQQVVLLETLKYGSDTSFT